MRDDYEGYLGGTMKINKKEIVIRHLIDNCYLNSDYAYDEFSEVLQQYVREELPDEDILIDAVYKQIVRDESVTI